MRRSNYQTAIRAKELKRREKRCKRIEAAAQVVLIGLYAAAIFKLLTDLN